MEERKLFKQKTSWHMVVKSITQEVILTNIIRITAGHHFDQEIEVVTLNSGINLEDLQNLIGAGTIDIVNPVFLQTLYDSSAVMIVDDLGAIILGTEFNQLASHLYGGNIFGPVLIAKRSREDLVGLENAEELKEKLMKALGRK